MDASKEALTAQSPDQARKGAPVWLEIAAVAVTFAALLFGARWIGFPYGGAIAMIGCVLMVTLFQHFRGETWRDLGFKRPRTLSSVALGGLIMIGVIVTALTVNIILEAVLPQFFGGSLNRTTPDVSTWTNYIILMVIVWTTAAFGEEMVFRGFFMTRIAEAFGKGVVGWTAALILPAAFFGFAHNYQGLAGMIITGSVGLVFGLWFLIARRNLVPLIIAHGILSSVGATVLFLSAQGVLPADAIPARPSGLSTACRAEDHPGPALHYRLTPPPAPPAGRRRLRPGRRGLHACLARRCDHFQTPGCGPRPGWSTGGGR
jgi:membrane protease YdiL (CAAX protease family)